MNCYLLPIKWLYNGLCVWGWGGGGGGGPVPWGRRHWVGIHFCHPEVVKLQQQCHMQNTISDLPPNWFYSFFSGRGRVPISWRQQQKNWKKKWKWQSSKKVVYMSFNHDINVWVFHGISSSFRVQTWTWRNWKNPTKRLFLWCCCSGKFRE